MANADEDTSKSTNSTRAQHSTGGSTAGHYMRERSVASAKRAMDLAFSTDLKRSKPTPSAYTALARSTTPSDLQRKAA